MGNKKTFGEKTEMKLQEHFQKIIDDLFRAMSQESREHLVKVFSDETMFWLTEKRIEIEDRKKTLQKEHPDVQILVLSNLSTISRFIEEELMKELT